MNISRSLLITIPTMILLLGGCALKSPLHSEGSHKKMSVEQYEGQLPDSVAKNWTQRFGKYKFEMKLDPEKPKVNENVVVEFWLSDVTKDPAWPVRNALIVCRARMPNVPGHIHEMKTHKYHPENLPGQYQMVPIKFTMGGQWDLVVQVLPTDKDEFFAVFPIEVEGPPWPPNYVSPENRILPSRDENMQNRLQ